MADSPRTDGDDSPVINLAPADQFRRLIALIVDGIVVVDTEGRVRLVNPAAEQLLGRKGRDLVGHLFGFPIVSDEATEIEIVRAHSESVVVEMRVAETEWDGEQAFVASLRDVTQRANFTEQQQQMIQRLRELDEMKTEFVSMVSHDLRAPMAAIAGYADMLRSNWGAFGDDRKVEIIERISRSTNQLARFVENILQVSQIESGNLTYDIKALDLQELTRRVVEENTVVGPDSDVPNIEVNVPDDLPNVRADEIRQWQIMTNLVTNALKFSPPDKPVVLKINVDGDFAVVSVSDSGFGIRNEDMGRLFQKFSRLEQPAGQKIKGTGLGLYICKAMIEAQGGKVSVESEFGRGTTFTYTVPLAP